MEQSIKLVITLSTDILESIKQAGDKSGISIEEFLIQSALEKMEDDLLTEEAGKVLDDIRSGHQTTLNWDEVKNQISQ